MRNKFSIKRIGKGLITDKTTKVFLFVLFLVFVISPPNQAQSLQWLSQVSGTIGDENLPTYYLSVTTDHENNIYCAGILKGSSDYEDGRFFASKRSPDGIIIWEKIYEEPFSNGNGRFDEIVYSISTAMFNRILIGGEANNRSKLLTINRNTGELFNDTEITGGENKIVALGVPLNVNHLPNGPCYVVGYFRGEIQLPGQSNPITLASSDGVDIFIGKWNVSYFSEVAHISGPNDQVPFDIEIAPNRQLYLSYLTKGSVWLNQEQILNTITSIFSGYILKLDANFDLIYNSSVVNGQQQIMIQQPTFLSAGNEGGGDILNKFPITLDRNNNLYFYFTRSYGQNESKKRVLGVINALTGTPKTSKYINLYNSSGTLLYVEDIAVSKCDSLYLIANEQHLTGGATVASFSTGSPTTHLITFSTPNLVQTMGISSYPSYSKAEELFIDSDGKVGFCGFYAEEEIQFGEIGLSSDNYDARGIVARYAPCQNPIIETEMIEGPTSICPENYPVSWSFSPPGNATGCQWVVEATSDDHPNPLSIINFSTPTSNNPVFTINDLNGYIYPIKIKYVCDQNCCNKVYDELVALPAQELKPSIEYLNITETDGNLTVKAKSANLSIPNIVYMWQLYEGEIISTGDDYNIVIKNEGTAQEVLVHQEYDAINNNEEAEYTFSGLGNKPYVIKLGVYYHFANGTTCGWRETRKGFMVGY
jgi:hypothetical protein